MLEYILEDCSCGIEYKKENYEVIDLKMTADDSPIKLSSKKVEQCKTCKDVLMYKLK
jgi:hypothetical protein